MEKKHCSGGGGGRWGKGKGSVSGLRGRGGGGQREGRVSWAEWQPRTACLHHDGEHRVAMDQAAVEESKAGLDRLWNQDRIFLEWRMTCREKRQVPNGEHTVISKTRPVETNIHATSPELYCEQSANGHNDAL